MRIFLGRKGRGLGEINKGGGGFVGGPQDLLFFNFKKGVLMGGRDFFGKPPSPSNRFSKQGQIKSFLGGFLWPF